MSAARVPWSKKFVDGVLRAAGNPDTFEIPSAAERHALVPGHHVAKLGFMLSKPMPSGFDGERMWVVVTAIEGDQYVGALNNDPLYLDLECGHVVRFGPEHVLAIDTVPEKKKRSGLRPVQRMRDRENAARSKRGEAPMVDVPPVESLRRAGSLISKLFGGKREPEATPSEPDAIEASGESVPSDEDDEASGGANRRLVSGG